MIRLGLINPLGRFFTVKILLLTVFALTSTNRPLASASHVASSHDEVQPLCSSTGKLIVSAYGSLIKVTAVKIAGNCSC